MVSGQFLRFAVVGAIGFAVDTLVLLALTQAAGLSPYLARGLSFTTAVCATWVLNRSWTFAAAKTRKSGREIAAEFLNYAAIQLVGGAANLVTFAVVVALLGNAPLVLVGATAAGSVAGMFVNYFGNKALVFGGEGPVKRLQRWIRRFLWLAAGTAILLVPAALNRGPFINYDSEQYYTIGHSVAGGIAGILGLEEPPATTPSAAPATLHEPAVQAPHEVGGSWASAFAGARSPFYSLFLYLGVQAVGLWGVAALQALFVAWLAALAVAEFGAGFSGRRFLLMIAGLTLASSVPFFAAWPMPDVFAGLALLAGVLFLLGRGTNLVEKIALWGLMAAAASFHSTIVILIGVVAMGGLVALWRLEGRAAKAIGAAALLLACVLPGIAGGRVYAALSEKVTGLEVFSPPFITARVIGDGTGQRFLKEQCPTGRYDFAVCRFQNRTFRSHNHFLWGLPGEVSAYQTSPPDIQRRLGEEQMRFVATVVGLYPAQQARASASNALRELTLIGMNREVVSVNGLAADWPDSEILKVTPQYQHCADAPAGCKKPRFLRAWEILTITGFLAAALALAFAAIRFARSADPQQARLAAAAAIVGLALLVNAAACGALSGVHSRYQSRIEWVLPALALAALPLFRRRV